MGIHRGMMDVIPIQVEIDAIGIMPREAEMESLLLSRRALASPTMCRFSPALSVPLKSGDRRNVTKVVLSFDA
jgi:hypothetical protein